MDDEPEPSAPPLELMDQVGGYEQASFDAGKSIFLSRAYHLFVIVPVCSRRHANAVELLKTNTSDEKNPPPTGGVPHRGEIQVTERFKTGT